MMKGTPEIQKGVEALIEAARNKDTGYEMVAQNFNGCIYLSIRQPMDTDTVAYPRIFFKEDWYSDDTLGFEIVTIGYSDHSIEQAKRVMAGLQIAIDLVETLLTTAETSGMKIRR